MKGVLKTMSLEKFRMSLEGFWSCDGGCAGKCGEVMIGTERCDEVLRGVTKCGEVMAGDGRCGKVMVSAARC